MLLYEMVTYRLPTI